MEPDQPLSIAGEHQEGEEGKDPDGEDRLLEALVRLRQLLVHCRGSVLLLPGLRGEFELREGLLSVQGDLR